MSSRENAEWQAHDIRKQRWQKFDSLSLALKTWREDSTWAHVTAVEAKWLLMYPLGFLGQFGSGSALYIDWPTRTIAQNNLVLQQRFQIFKNIIRGLIFQIIVQYPIKMQDSNTRVRPRHVVPLIKSCSSSILNISARKSDVSQFCGATRIANSSQTLATPR